MFARLVLRQRVVVNRVVNRVVNYKRSMSTGPIERTDLDERDLYTLTKVAVAVVGVGAAYTHHCSLNNRINRISNRMHQETGQLEHQVRILERALDHEKEENDIHVTDKEQQQQQLNKINIVLFASIFFNVFGFLVMCNQG